jgi:dihydroflavonol-4-reductase
MRGESIKKQNKLILVTGGTGLVGSHLIEALTNEGKKVRAIRRSMSVPKNLSGISSELLEWVDGDILDIYSIKEAMNGVEYVYHCAAFVSLNPSDKNKLWKINVEGTVNVVNMALEEGIKKFCFVSSTSALGRGTTKEIITEESIWTNNGENSFYGITKYNAEREVWRGIAEGMDAVIVNPAIIFGPGDWKKSSVKIFQSVWKGLKFYTEGANGFVDVRDVAKAMIQLTESEIKNEKFLLASENLSYKYIFDEIAQNFNKKAPTIKAGSKLSGFVWRAEKLRSLLSGKEPFITKDTARTANQINTYSSEKIKTALSFEFIPIKQSIRDTCEAFLKETN